MNESILCPYCYEDIDLGRVEIRCVNPECASRNIPMALTEAETKKAIGEGKKCACGVVAHNKYCPACHHKLPNATFASNGLAFTSKGIRRNIVISVIGQASCGKSVYLGVLSHELKNGLAHDLLPSGAVSPFEGTAERYERLHRPLYDVGDVNNLYKTAAREGIKNMSRDNLPLIWQIGSRVKTPFPAWLPWLGREKNQSFTMFLFDPAGEDVVMENNLKAKYYRYINHSTGFIFLLDPAHLPGVRALHSESTGDATAFGKMLDGIIRHLRDTNRVKESKRIDIPMAIALAKFDEAEQLFPPGSMAGHDSPHRRKRAFDEADARQVSLEVSGVLREQGAGNLLDLIELNFSQTAYFALSALGKGNQPQSGAIMKPRPHRVEDPLLWLWHKVGLIESC